MRRRDFLAAIAAGTTMPALPAERVARIGILSNLSDTDTRVASFWQAFRDDLRERGWIEGKNLVIVGRFTEGALQLSERYSDELLAERPDVLVVSSTQFVIAVRHKAGSVPIVANNVAFPVETGLVASMARPGGNITGVTNHFDNMQGRQLQALKTIRPGLRTVGFFWSPASPVSALLFKDAQAAATALGIMLIPLPLDGPDSLERVLALAAAERVQAISANPTPAISSVSQRIAQWAMEKRLPTITGTASAANEGMLLSYGPDFHEVVQLLAGLVDKVLRGAKPADLPVMQPTRLWIVVNVRTAKRIGITIPAEVLSAASEVIE